jgi:hypothetical protein
LNGSKHAPSPQTLTDGDDRGRIGMIFLAERFDSFFILLDR